MNTAEQIILLILAGVLLVFLALAITAIIFVLRLIATLRRIADKAEYAVDSATNSVGSILEMLKKASGPMTILSFVKNIVDVVSKRKADK